MYKRQIHNSYVSVKDWYELIQEARAVLYNKIQEVGMRYVSEDHYCYMDPVSYTHLPLYFMNSDLAPENGW